MIISIINKHIEIEKITIIILEKIFLILFPHFTIIKEKSFTSLVLSNIA